MTIQGSYQSFSGTQAYGGDVGMYLAPASQSSSSFGLSASRPWAMIAVGVF